MFTLDVLNILCCLVLLEEWWCIVICIIDSDTLVEVTILLQKISAAVIWRFWTTCRCSDYYFIVFNHLQNYGCCVTCSQANDMRINAVHRKIIMVENYGNKKEYLNVDGHHYFTPPVHNAENIYCLVSISCYLIWQDIVYDLGYRNIMMYCNFKVFLVLKLH